MTYAIERHDRIAVIGAGSMGSGIAQLAAQCGHPVALYDAGAGAAAAALARTAIDLDAGVQRGRISPETRRDVLARIHVVEAIGGLEGSALAIEAIVERLDAKQSLFRQLEELLGDDAILASNTSSISITSVAQGLRRPGRVVGWHFFNPATRMKLVEVVAGVDTKPAVVAAMRALSAAWGKTAVDAPNTPGFIVNRVARPLYAEGLRLLAERAAPDVVIDRLMREAGCFAMGPFELMDLIGIDVNLSVTEQVFQSTAYDPRFAPHVIQQELVRAGRHGRKTGRGFYDYADGAARPPADAVSPAASVPSLRCAAHMTILAPLIERLRASGIVVTEAPSLPEDSLDLGGTRVFVTDGRTAAQRSAELEGAPVVLVDLASDLSTAVSIGACASPPARDRLPQLAAALGRAGIALLALDDVAGLVVMRIVCCLANEAADLLSWTNVTAADVDTAMRLGTAYPKGPLAWADEIGAPRVANVLRNLHQHYGDARYRLAPRLSRAFHANGDLHG